MSQMDGQTEVKDRVSVPFYCSDERGGDAEREGGREGERDERVWQ